MALTIRLIDGFETQGFERASATGGSQQPTINTTNVRPDTEGLACLSAVDGNTGYADYLPYEYEGSANSNAKAIGWWMRYGGAGTITVLRVYSGGTGGTLKCEIRLSGASSGRLLVYDKNSTLISSVSAPQIFTDTSWHLVEFWFEDGSDNADWELFVDGTSYQSAQSTASFDASNSNAFRIGQINSVGTPAAKIDDIYYAEATATTDLVSQQGYNGLDIFACVGDGTSTTSGSAFSTGTDADVQEIPVNDTNYGGWSDPTLTNEFRYPTAILTQTNLTGSITDIDDNPDSPDGLWMTASGKSTLHVQVQDPVYNPQIGTGLQKLRVLLRKNATGPTPSTDRIAPDTIATQTNLTGSVTDIDDDPDSPDANWLTASGSSTLRTTFSTPSSNPVTGAGLQEFRVLLRKNATGPSGTNTEDVLPNGLGASDANLNGTAADIDDDPQSPGGDWRTAQSDNANSVCHAQFATPANTPATGAGLQTFEIYARLTTNGTACTYNVYLYENGTVLNGGTAIATGSLTSTTGQLITATWNASLLGTADGSLVECVFEVVKSGGNPASRTSGEVDAVRWVSAYSATETQPGYEVKLYENGSEVVAAGSATGNLTDAGGNTVVSFTWDATNLGTADGSLVECYVNQTSGADRYIEIGAVEWNCYNGPSEFTPAYELKLYENGSEVVAAGSTTGTLTDAGGDTIVELSWDASLLSNPTGDDIEVYINQTDASPTRYIEVGAVQVHIQRYVSWTRYLKADGTGSFTGPSTGRTLDGAILGGSALVRHRYTGSGTHLDSVVGLGGTSYAWVSTGTLTAAWANKHVLVPANVLPTITQDSTIRWARRDVDYTDVGIDWSETIPQFAYAPTQSILPLQATAGSYSITGVDASLEHSAQLDAVSGVYSISGATADFALSKNLFVDAGNYAITGVDVEFLKDSAVLTETGSYSITGVDASLEADRYLSTSATNSEIEYFDTGGEDNTKKWTNEPNAVDGSTATYAFTTTEGYIDTQQLPPSAPWYGTYFLYNITFAAIPTGKKVAKVRYRLYMSVTGTGTPQMEVSVRGTSALHNRYGWLQQDYITQVTPGWTDWIDVTPPAKSWGDDSNLFNIVRLYCAGQDPTGTMTEARIYKAEVEVFLSDAVYQLVGYAPSAALQPLAGSYAITGVDTDLDRALQLESDAGSYSITGVDANLTSVVINDLLAEAGSYSIGGAAPTLKKDVDIHVDAGAYAITGESIDADRSLILKANTGSYAITGAPATLARQLPVGAVTGDYTITGVDIDLLRAVILQAESGSYTITGADADFTLAFSLDAESGTYTITGEATALNKALQLEAEAGSYSITGEPMAVVTAGTLAAQTGVYTITGIDADTLAQLQLGAESGIYNITGVDADFTVSIAFSAESGTYTITGSDAALQRISIIAEEVGIYAITGEDANLIYDTGALAVDAGTYTLTGFDANLNHITSARRVIIVA
jgi:hypothetical protein